MSGATKKRHDVRRGMIEVVAFIQGMIKHRPEIDHCDLCQFTADEYDLWYGEKGERFQRFPLWLSRVVEGEMRDAGCEL
jgi:hypothetical protein